MMTKTKLALVAALIAGYPSIAQASEALDANMGLRTEFYEPLHELERQGVPSSDRARLYLRENPPPFAYRGDGFGARAQAPTRGRRNAPTYCVPGNSRTDSTGAPTGPYCFEN